jgi:hypothetical protein
VSGKRWHGGLLDPRQERYTISLSAYVLTFGLVRGVITLNRRAPKPSEGFSIKGVHIHHMVWGILLLIVTGYSWLAGQVNTRRRANLGAAAFGIGSALTLDESSLIVMVEDDYFAEAGKVGAVVAAFGACLAGLPLIKHGARKVARAAQRPAR